jgi:hypothetical protein
MDGVKPCKPLLALDVDGPIVLQGSVYDEPVFEAWAGEIPVTISTQVAERLDRLAQHFTLVWSSSWHKSANRWISPLVGLPSDLPWIDFGRYRPARPGESRKLPGLIAWLKDRPAAIVDDEIGLDMRAWAGVREAATLLVEVDPRRGLTQTQVEELLSFARGTQ